MVVEEEELVPDEEVETPLEVEVAADDALLPELDVLDVGAATQSHVVGSHSSP